MEDSLILAENEHGRYCVPEATDHRFAALAVQAGRVHEPDTLRLLCELGRDGLVVHAGAFFGDMLPGLHRSGAEVLAFEPGDTNWLHALGTMALNNIGPRVTLLRAALGAAGGRARLVTAEEHRGELLELGGGCYVAEHGQQLTDVVRLDDVAPLDRPVSVIHLDVERYEVPALRGAAGTIRRCRPVVILETVPDDVAELLPGYENTALVHHNAVFEPR